MLGWNLWALADHLKMILPPSCSRARSANAQTTLGWFLEREANRSNMPESSGAFGCSKNSRYNKNYFLYVFFAKISFFLINIKLIFSNFWFTIKLLNCDTSTQFASMLYFSSAINLPCISNVNFQPLFYHALHWKFWPFQNSRCGGCISEFGSHFFRCQSQTTPAVD